MTDISMLMFNKVCAYKVFAYAKSENKQTNKQKVLLAVM